MKKNSFKKVLSMMAAAAIIMGNTACNNAQQGKEMSMISEDSLSAGSDINAIGSDVNPTGSDINSDESDINPTESDINPTESEKDQDEQGNAQIIKIYNYLDNTDVKNENKLLNSMRSVVNDHSEESDFIGSFIENPENAIFAENPAYKIIRDMSEDESSIVFLIKGEDSEYPEIAYGLRFEESKAVDSSEYPLTDYMEPLADHQDVTVIKDESGKTVKAEYSTDPKEYGTYDSTGVVYYDESGRPVLKEYYTTSGNRYMAYVYEENELVMICDFGGMAYKGMDDDPDTEIGIDFSIYFIS